MDIHTFKRVVKYLEPSKTSDGKVMRPPAIMITGRHGIGKSGVMRQVAKEVCGLPLIDRRIGQMCEGDLVGLQKIDGEFTKFLPVEFIHRAAKEPHFLFFDEANRGTKEVMQVMFQLVLDYELNGVVLHPDTRIAIAVNEGSQYTVTQMDPALRDRFFYVELEPTVDEWLEWASAEGLNNAIISFNRQRHSNLDTPADTRVSGRTQSRRSWHMLSAPLDRLMKQDGFAVEKDECLYELFSLASGFVGDALAADFKEYVKENCKRPSAEDVLTDWPATRRRLELMGGNPWMHITDVVAEWAKDGRMTDAQRDMFCDMFNEAPAEYRMALWQKIAQMRVVEDEGTLHNITLIHSKIKRKLVAAMIGEDEAEKRFAEDEERYQKFMAEEAARAAEGEAGVAAGA